MNQLMKIKIHHSVSTEKIERIKAAIERELSHNVNFAGLSYELQLADCNTIEGIGDPDGEQFMSQVIFPIMNGVA